MHDIKQIIVTTDFSPESGNAVGFALLLANHFDAKMDVFHLMNLPFNYDQPNLSTYPMAGESGHDMLERYPELKKKVGSAIFDLQHIAKQIEEAGIEGNTHLLTNKSISDLKKINDDVNGDLIITGTRGKGDSEFSGSFAQKLFKHAERPVIAVKNPMTHLPKSILFASDYDDSVELHTAYKQLLDINKAIGAGIHYLRVNTPVNFESTDSSLKYLREFSNRYKIDKERMKIYNAFSIEEGICDYASDNHIDMIAVFSRGFKGFRRLLHHSVSANVINFSKIPILLLKP